MNCSDDMVVDLELANHDNINSRKYSLLHTTSYDLHETHTSSKRLLSFDILFAWFLNLRLWNGNPYLHDD